MNGLVATDPGQDMSAKLAQATSEQVKPRGSVDMAMDELQKVLNSLGEDVARLNDKFSPVLRAQDPQEPQGETNAGEGVPPMVRAIAHLILQAQQINRNVRDIDARCEL